MSEGRLVSKAVHWGRYWPWSYPELKSLRYKKAIRKSRWLILGILTLKWNISLFIHSIRKLSWISTFWFRLKIRIQRGKLSSLTLQSLILRLNKVKTTFILNCPIKRKEKDFHHCNEEDLYLVELTYEFKTCDHDGQSSLNTHNKMSSCETTCGTKTVETALPEH